MEKMPRVQLVRPVYVELVVMEPVASAIVLPYVRT